MPGAQVRINAKQYGFSTLQQNAGRKSQEVRCTMDPEFHELQEAGDNEYPSYSSIFTTN